MEEMSFFEAFGLTDDSIFGFGEKEKKTEKKTDKKPAEKKPADKKAEKKPEASADFDVALPVTIKGRSFSKEVTLDGAASAKVSAVWDELKKEYPQFSIGGFELVYVSELKTVVVCDGNLTATPDNASVFSDDDGLLSDVVVADGGTVCTLSHSDFEEQGLESDEVTLGDVRDRFVAANPAYKGCSLHFDESSKVAYPVFTKAAAGKAGDMIDVNANGTTVTVEADDKSLAEKVGGTIPGVTPYVMTGGENFLSYRNAKTKGASVYSKNASSASSGKVKTVEKKYALPFTLLVSNFNMTYDLTSDMFDGKEKVTKEEITQGMKAVEPLFGDSDRKVEYLYNEAKNLMSCMFISGRKG